MRFYVAGSFVDQKEIRAEADRLWALGHEVTSTWLQEVARPDYLTSDQFKQKLAMKDIAEVYAADCIILDNRRSSGGKNTEWGVGLGQFQKKLLWLIGEPSSVFHYLADTHFASWDELIATLPSHNIHPEVQI